MCRHDAAPCDTLAILLGASSWPDLDLDLDGEPFENSFFDFDEYLRRPDGLALTDKTIFKRFNSTETGEDIINTISGKTLTTFM